MVSLSKAIHKMQRSKEKGFTLIELMIVVAIIGILAAIAIPNFLRFQAKSKQGEAKTNLGAIGTTAEAFRAENDTYVTDFNGLGWAPQGSTRYSYYYGTDTIARTVTPSGGATLSMPGAVAAATTAFTTGACGDIDSDTAADGWEYNNVRRLWSSQDDVSAGTSTGCG